MDGFQITILILGGVILVLHGAALAMGYRAMVRREERANAAAQTAGVATQRLTDIENLLKSYGPSIQRATDAASQRLAEIETVLKSCAPTIQHAIDEAVKQLVEANGVLRTVDRSSAEATAEARALNRDLTVRVDHANGQREKLLEQGHQVEVMGDRLRQLLSESRELSEESATDAAQNAAALRAAVDQLTVEIAALRADMQQLTHF